MNQQDRGRCLVVLVISLLWVGTSPVSSMAIASSSAMSSDVALPPGTPAAMTELGQGVAGEATRATSAITAWTQAAELTASANSFEDWFGYTVAVSGDVVVVGALQADPGGLTDAGAAYVFVRPGGWAGKLTQVATLTASDAAAGDWFGASVAISGDVIVVGSPRSDPGGTTNAGAAYVFVKPAGGWAGSLHQTARLSASDKAAAAEFGISVAISGEGVVVGAHQAAPGGTAYAGAAYVFTRPSGGWSGSLTQTAKLTASDRAAGDLFGSAVAMSGDVIAIGAHEANPNGIIDAGVAYVFVKPVGGWTGSLTQTAKLTAAIQVKGDVFGTSVAVNNDVIIVGATRSRASGTHAGAAYLFVKPAGGWTGSLIQTATLAPLNAPTPALSDYFGQSVAISGDLVLIGAPMLNAAYVFVKPAGGWTGSLTSANTLTAADPADAFGFAVALDGNTTVIGAPETDLGATLSAGAAYVFRGAQAMRAHYLPLVLRR
ncbi:MAG: hypothetical protein NT169_22645 [Chloroflexi bacterium]|nr:hypothetical protein [Chloroflexota bacterium]